MRRITKQAIGTFVAILLVGSCMRLSGNSGGESVNPVQVVTANMRVDVTSAQITAHGTVLQATLGVYNGNVFPVNAIVACAQSHDGVILGVSRINIGVGAKGYEVLPDANLGFTKGNMNKVSCIVDRAQW